MEALQKIDVPDKINESLNINIVEEPVIVETNNSEKLKTYAIFLILFVFVLFLLRYLLNYTILGQNIKNSVSNFFYNIEVGGKKIFENIKEVKNFKKDMIKETKNTLQELENAVNKNVRSVSKNLKNKNLVNKKLLQSKKLLESKKQLESKKLLKNKQNNEQEEPKRVLKREIEADKSTNTIQTRSKTGFCYVGNDRGYRSCMEIDQMDKCVSNQIFPTRELCINPTLRA